MATFAAGRAHVMSEATRTSRDNCIMRYVRYRDNVVPRPHVEIALVLSSVPYSIFISICCKRCKPHLVQMPCSTTMYIEERKRRKRRSRSSRSTGRISDWLTTAGRLYIASLYRSRPFVSSVSSLLSPFTSTDVVIQAISSIQNTGHAIYFTVFNFPKCLPLFNKTIIHIIYQ